MDIPISDSSDFYADIFGNEMLLTEIIEKLDSSTTDLTNCRLVDKRWKCLATRHLKLINWEERRFLTFVVPEEKIQSFCETYKSSANASACANEDDKMSPLYSCFRIKIRCPNTNSLDSDSLINMILSHVELKMLNETFAHKIKSLDFQSWYTPLSSHALNLILQNQSSSLTELNLECGGSNLPPFEPISNTNYLLPQLKYLCLSFIHGIRPPTPQDASCQLAILDFICSKIPPRHEHGHENSIKICLMGMDCSVGEIIAVFQTYQLISSLKSISLGKEMESRDCQKLVDSGAKVDYLWLRSRAKQFPGIVGEIGDLLNSQKAHLKMLSWSGNVDFQFPRYATMKEITNLKLEFTKYFHFVETLEGLEGDADGHAPAHAHAPRPARPLLYGQYFPKLEVLELSSYFLDGQPLQDFHSKFLAPQFQCPNVQVLEIQNARINAETINLISEIFSRLKILHVGLYNHGEGEEFSPENEKLFYSALWSGNFATTLEQLGIDLGLEEIVVEDGRQRDWAMNELDSLFAGLPIQQIQQFSLSGEKYHPNQNQNPSILKFTKLKKLAIFNKNDTNISAGTGFTNFSALVLFAHMKELEYLHINANIHEFTEVALEYLITRGESNRKEKVKTTTTPTNLFSNCTNKIEKEFRKDWNTNYVDKKKIFNLLTAKKENPV